jgi:hypothetical protein
VTEELLLPASSDADTPSNTMNIDDSIFWSVDIATFQDIFNVSSESDMDISDSSTKDDVSVEWMTTVTTTTTDDCSLLTKTTTTGILEPTRLSDKDDDHASYDHELGEFIWDALSCL